MFGLGYKKCPHYESGDRLKRRVTDMEDIVKDNNEQWEYLKNHMEGEEVHHQTTRDSIVETNEAMVEMSQAVKTLVDDKKERDKIKDKRESRRDKIFTALAIAFILGLSKILLDLYATQKILGVE